MLMYLLTAEWHVLDFLKTLVYDSCILLGILFNSMQILVCHTMSFSFGTTDVTINLIGIGDMAILHLLFKKNTYIYVTDRRDQN